MTELGGVTISERAKRLIEALHELSSNEAKWLVAQAFLDEASAFGWEHHKRRLVLGYVPCILDGHNCDQPACHSGPCDAATPARALEGVGATVEKANEDGGGGSVAEE